MAAFEHVATLIAFVFALAIAHVLSTLIALIRAGSRVRYSFAHGAWFLSALYTVYTWWLAMYDFHSLRRWDVLSITIWLIGAVFVYMYSGLVSPEVPSEGLVDLDQFHFAHGRQYQAALVAAGIVAIVLGVIGEKAKLPDQIAQTAFAIPGILIALTALVFRNRFVQNLCAAIQLVTIPVYLYFGQQSLS